MVNGYIKNMTHTWAHTMKRDVGPGQKIPLVELYEQYGKKHDLNPGEEFIQWLVDIKLRDRNKWRVFNDDDTPYKMSNEPEVKEKPKPVEKPDGVAPMVNKGMQIEDVVGLSVRKAREVVPTIQDIQLLRYAVREANQLSGKDSLCRILRKRISELEVSTRR